MIITITNSGTTPTALIKEGGGYLLQSYKSYGLKQPIDYQLRSFLGFFLRAVGSVAL